MAASIINYDIIKLCVISHFDDRWNAKKIPYHKQNILTEISMSDTKDMFLKTRLDRLFSHLDWIDLDSLVEPDCTTEIFIYYF
jgi:hypothetical protein